MSAGHSIGELCGDDPSLLSWTTRSSAPTGMEESSGSTSQAILLHGPRQARPLSARWLGYLLAVTGHVCFKLAARPRRSPHAQLSQHLQAGAVKRV